MLDADNGRQSLQRIRAGEIRILFLEQTRLARVVVDHAGDRSAHTGQVATTIGCVDGIGKGQFGRGGSIRVLEGHVDPDGVLLLGVSLVDHNLALGVDDRMQRLAIAVDVAHEGLDATFEMEGHVPADRLDPLVTHCERHAACDKSHLAEALNQRHEIELWLLHDGSIGLEADGGPGALYRLHITNGAHLAGRLAAMIFLLPDLAVAPHGSPHPLGKRIDGRDTHPVQTAGHLVRLPVELATCPDARQHQLKRRDLLGWVLAHGDTPTVVINRHGAVIMQHNLDGVTAAGQRLVDGVVHDLVDQVVQCALIGAAHIHTRPAADMLHAFQVLDCCFGIL